MRVASSFQFAFDGAARFPGVSSLFLFLLVGHAFLFSQLYSMVGWGCIPLVATRTKESPPPTIDKQLKTSGRQPTATIETTLKIRKMTPRSKTNGNKRKPAGRHHREQILQIRKIMPHHRHHLKNIGETVPHRSNPLKSKGNSMLHH